MLREWANFESMTKVARLKTIRYYVSMLWNFNIRPVMKHVRARENENHEGIAWNFDTSVITALENGARNMTLRPSPACNSSYVENIEGR